MTRKKSRNFNTLCALAFTALSMLTLSANAVVPDNQTSTAPAGELNDQLANRLIVKYKNNSAAQALQAAGVQNITAEAARSSKRKVKYLRKMATGAHVMYLEGKLTKAQRQKAIADMATDPNIEYVEPDRILQIMATPSDPSYNQQWHYYEATGGLNLPTAWDTATGSGVVVAVIDTGYLPHADLVGNLLPGYDMISSTSVAADGNGRDSDASDPGDSVTAGQCGVGQPARSSSWHGTHVAGTVAAVTNNGIGVAGVAYDAKIVPVRVLGKCGGFTSDIADGMIWAAGGSVSGVPSNPNPAQVLNLSLGGGGSCDSTSQAAINQAVALGATVVVAAGNSNTNASSATPANCNNVVTVASTDRSGGRAYYSNYGSVVDVAAPGGETNVSASNGVLSTLNTGSTTPASDNYEFYQGTSMAAPHVAGAAALMYQADPSITPAAVESLLKSSARSFPSTCSQCGTGIVDATAALAAIGGGGGGGNVLQKAVPETGLSGSTGNEIFYTIDVPAGASDLTFQISGGSGDADLYVRFGAAPTTSTYDCRPWLNGNNETCTFASPSAGTYHVMIRAYSTYSGVSLVADYTEPGGGGGQADSISESGLSASRRQWLNFTLDVPAGQSLMTAEIFGGSGDADLYVRYGSNPTTSSYDCRPYLNGNNETCSFSNPAAGTWYIRIRAYQTFSGVSLEASSQ